MTERYLGSIISSSPVEPSSNLSNATASGVWNIHDPLIFGQAGDWPDPTNVPSVGIVAGGQNNDSSGTVLNIIEKFVPESAGNATDFGDLTVARHASSSIGNDTRAIFAGGWDNYAGSSRSNVIDYITYTTTGNATDFGDVAATTSDANSSASNNVRGITFGGRLYSDGTLSNSIEYLTIASTGNATDFGDLSITPNTSANKARHRQGNGMSGSTTRGLASGGYTPYALSDTIQYVTIASRGDSVDFGNLSAATDELSFMSSNTRAVIAGGSGGGASIRNTMEYVTIASTGNVTDFGDMTVAKAYLMGASSSTKGFVIGGSTSGDIANTVNTIETITFSTTGDATDFGDLVTLNRSGSANASSHAAVQNETGFAPAAMGLLVGTGPTGSQTTIQYLDIATTGSYAMFGDIHVGADYDQANGTIANATRGVFAEGATGNTYYYSTFSTKGKTTDFGDHATNSFRGIATSNGTRGLRGGGFNGSAYQNNIEYITIASTGNGTDFGDLSAVTQYGAAASSTTRSVFHLGGTGGSGTTAVNTLEYVTIGSTGDTTDFGDLSSARDETAAVNSSTRGVFGGGDTGSASDIMDYITLASTGNATDFGDLTQARDRLSGVCSTTRGIFTDGDSSNYVDYITIASTGDATDFGTPLTTTYRGTGSSNSHGGIS